MTGALRVITIAVIAGAASTIGPFAARAAAQARFTYVGPKQCTNCHDHEEEKLWYEKKEIPEAQRLFPDSKNAGHINSLKQLETPKSDEFAKAVGLADKYDPAGLCATCHATVFRGDVNAGVSCESCHGPASGYIEPHQKKDTYDASVAQFGMTRLIGNFAGWTQQCTNCHVMSDSRLIAAGHPSGDDFDLSKKFLPVSLHFKKTYAPADVDAIASGEMQAALRRRRAITAAAAAPPQADAARCGRRRNGCVLASGGSGGRAVGSAGTTIRGVATTLRCALRIVARRVFGTAAPRRAARPAEATAERAAPSQKSARSSPLAAAANPPRPRPRVAPIDPANPPAGSPTSIEPPPLLPTAADGAPQSAAAAPVPSPSAAPERAVPTTPPTAVAVRTGPASWYVWVGLAVVLVAVAIAVLARKRR